jgi:(1->4)-alpha-D-glucan 1-alpha-D-glucosylmutase
VLLKRYSERVPEQHRAMLLRFAMKVQQLTGPVMAKGLEDTAFYVFNRLTSLNEVGGEPERFGTPPSVFHLRNQERAEYWPASVITTSTHDTKRSEDVRARINVISERVAEWDAGLSRWASWNERHKVEVKEALVPERNDEYLFYQALLGAWPMGEHPSEPEWEAFRGRISGFMQKAIKEAKVHTSWTNPDPDYDAATQRFVERALDRSLSREFLEDFEQLKRKVERTGQVNALGQLVLKIASPGACDFYQGQELWELSLVDPDSRRPVDYAKRQVMLEALDRRAAEDRRALCDALWAKPADGAIKLYATAEGLRLRGRHPQLFRRGGYVPLEAEGALADRIVAFLRVFEDDVAMAVVPRLVTAQLEASGGLGAAFRNTRILLPAGSPPPVPVLTHVFTGEQFSPGREAPSLDAGELFAHCPVALLEKRGR